jgi:hypothetical protein
MAGKFLNMVVYDPAVAPADERIADVAAVAEQMRRGVPLTYGHAGNRIRDVCQTVADSGLTLSAANVASELGTWRIGQVFDAFVDGRGRIHATARLHDAVCRRLRADGLGVSLSHFISGSDERPVELALTRDPIRPGCRVTGSQPHQTYRTTVMAEQTTTTTKRPAETEAEAPPPKRQRTTDGRFTADAETAAAAAEELHNAPETVREALAVVLARHKAQSDARQREAEAKLAALTEELNKRKQNDEVLDHMRESQAADTASWLENTGGLTKEQVEAMMPLLKENAFNALGEGLRVCSHGGRRGAGTSRFAPTRLAAPPAAQTEPQQQPASTEIQNPTMRSILDALLMED